MSESKGGALGGLGGFVEKAKEVLTDERIDQVAGLVKERTSDSVDKHVDTVAEQAKKLNG
jgi:hypothetical protein